jgi:hypothetical protein
VFGESVAPAGVLDLTVLAFVYSTALALLCFPGLALAVALSRVPRSAVASGLVGAAGALLSCSVSAAGAIDVFGGMNPKNAAYSGGIGAMAALSTYLERAREARQARRLDIAR